GTWANLACDVERQLPGVPFHSIPEYEMHYNPVADAIFDANDVPLQDMYNRGLVLTQEGRERTNLQLEGGERCGLTGLIPSAEQGMMMGASPKPQGILMALGAPDENQIEMSKKRRGLTR
ncbi:MAG: hypothetical protein MUO67_05235, partial [Anaerolineales bacterium]|nr:hypothetical protein [Anaerolineales bacterium]